MRRLILASVIFILLFLVFGNYKLFSQTTDLLISEYGEGSSGNSKYIEIYNGTGGNVDLSNYGLWRVSNGGSWPEATLSLSGILSDGSTYVVANNSTDVPGADLYNAFCSWNGDDAVGLAKSGSLIDVVGEDGPDPGTGWDVAGTTDATKDHRLTRKSSICSPNTDWNSSRGTNTTDSEWIVDTYVTGSANSGHSASCSSGPEIQLQQPVGTNVACGYTYDFGTQTTGTNTDVTIRIENIGTSNLTISSYPLSGTNAAEFSVFTAPSSPISAGSSTDMVIRFSPVTAGGKTAAITINSDDADEGSCIINFTATAVDPCTTPTAQPTGLNLTSNTTTSSIDGSFTAASPAADSYLVVYSTNNSLSSNPVDGTTYSLGDALGGGTVVDNISGTTFTASSLTSGTEYYFFIFSNNNASCSGGPVYNTTSPLTGSEITIPANASWNTAGCVSNTTIDLSWTAATGNSTGYLLVVREGATPHSVNSLDPSTQTFNTDYSIAPQFGSTTPYSRVVYKGTGTSVTITGLTQGTSYTFKLHTYTIGSTDYVYSTGTQQTNTINLDDVTSASGNSGNAQGSANWANPTASCFDEILVVVNETSGIGFSPSGDGSAYTANTVYAAPDQVIYKGIGTNVTVTNLTNGTNYYFEIFVRKGTEWSQGVEVMITPNVSTVLSQGDLAVVGLCSNISSCISGTSAGDDEISFVCFQDITTNTEFDMTDNGWQRVNANLWGSSEGTIRAKRTGATIVKGTVITFRFHVGGTYECIFPDNNWTFTQLNAVGADLIMNSNGDQIYFMQDGAWVDGATVTSHDADYVGGTILFGFNSYSSWDDFINSTQRSGLIGGMDCFNMMPSGASDYLKYDGPMTPASQIEWVGRINDNTNWSSYSDCSTYYANGTDYTNGDTLDITTTGLTGTFQWYGNKDTHWFDCANWGPLRVPTASNDVIIPNSSQVDTDIVLVAGENAECNNFTVEDTNHTIKGENGSTKVLTVNGDLTINGGSIDFDDGNNTTTDGTIYVKGNWINNNNTTDFVRGNSTVIFNGNTTQTITSNTGLENFGNVQITGSSILNLNGNDLEISGNWTNYNQSGLTEGTSTITFDGTANQNINTTGGEVIYDVVIDNPTTVTLSNNLTISNQLNQSQGELIINGKTLTLQNDLIRTTGTFTGSNSSNMTINGSGNLATALYFTPGSESLNNLTVNRSSSGTVTMATNLTIYGQLGMSAGELDINDKVLTLNGTISGTGTLKGSANSELYIGGSGNLGTLYFSTGLQEVKNLTTNRSSGISTLGTDLTVNTLLTLTNGLITTGTNKLIISTSNASAVTGQNTNSYVNGNLQRAFASNTDTYAFPVGTATMYTLSEIVNNNLVGISYIDAKFLTSFSNSGSLDPAKAVDFGTPYADISPEGIWYLEPDIQPTGGDYTIKLHFDDGGGANAFSGLSNNQFGPLKRDVSSTSAFDWSALNGTLNANNGIGRMISDGFAQRNGITSFSHFAIGRTNIPLPVELIDFDATVQNNTVKLDWITAAEINNDYFTVERSPDAVNFEVVQTVQGAGNSRMLLQYSAFDFHPLIGKSYYRLRQTDFDGKSTVSKMIPVDLSDGDNNAVNYTIQNDFLFVNSGQVISISVYDVTGKLIIQKDSKGGNLKISLSTLKQHQLYFLKIQSTDKVVTDKFFR